MTQRANSILASCTVYLVHYSTFRHYSQSFGQPSALCRRHQTSKINSTERCTKPYTDHGCAAVRSNLTRTKLKPFSSRHTLSLPSDCLPSSVTVGTHQIAFSDKVRNLGFIPDFNLTMKQHVKRISSISIYLTEDATKKLVTSCVLSRVDNCNSLLMGTPNSVIQPMQNVQNAAARLILRAPCHQHCTPLLQQLHWLPISERIKYKTAVCVTTQLLVPPPLTFLNYCSCTALPALSALHQTHVYSNSDA